MFASSTFLLFISYGVTLICFFGLYSIFDEKITEVKTIINNKDKAALYGLSSDLYHLKNKIEGLVARLDLQDEEIKRLITKINARRRRVKRSIAPNVDVTLPEVKSTLGD